MSFSTLVSSIVRGWYVIVACALLATLAALAANWTAKPTYTATSVVLLTSPADGGQAALAGAAPTLAQLATMSAVLEPSAQKLAYPGGAQALRKHVDSMNPSATSFIKVDATDSVPSRSAAISRTVSEQLMDYLNSSPQTKKQVTATMVEPAADPTTPSSTPRGKLLVTGFVGGLGLGLVIALLMGALRRSREAERTAAAPHPAPVATTAPAAIPAGAPAMTAPAAASAPPTPAPSSSTKPTDPDAPTTVIPTVRPEDRARPAASSTREAGSSPRSWLGRSR